MTRTLASHAESPPAYEEIYPPSTGRPVERVCRPDEWFQLDVRKKAEDIYRTDPKYAGLYSSGFSLPSPTGGGTLWKDAARAVQTQWERFGFWDPSWEDGKPGTVWGHEMDEHSDLRSPRQRPLFGMSSEPPRGRRNRHGGATMRRASHPIPRFIAYVWEASLSANDDNATLDNAIDTLVERVKREWNQRGFNWSRHVSGPERPREPQEHTRPEQHLENDVEAARSPAITSRAGEMARLKRTRCEYEAAASDDESGGGRDIKRSRRGSPRTRQRAPGSRQARTVGASSSSIAPSESDLSRGLTRTNGPSASTASNDVPRQDEDDPRGHGAAAMAYRNPSVGTRRSLRLRGGGPQV